MTEHRKFPARIQAREAVTGRLVMIEAERQYLPVTQALDEAERTATEIAQRRAKVTHRAGRATLGSGTVVLSEADAAAVDAMIKRRAQGPR